jgi:hypothetical protein
MSRTTILSLAGIGAVIALAAYTTFSQTRVECEVWMEYNGHAEQRTAASANREETVRSAVTSACATLAGDMGDQMRCARTPPQRVECRER